MWTYVVKDSAEGRVFLVNGNGSPSAVRKVLEYLQIDMPIVEEYGDYIEFEDGESLEQAGFIKHSLTKITEITRL